jgi:hypothetical protein
MRRRAACWPLGDDTWRHLGVKARVTAAPAARPIAMIAVGAVARVAAPAARNAAPCPTATPALAMPMAWPRPVLWHLDDEGGTGRDLVNSERR